MTPPNTEITPSRHTPEWKVNRIDYPRKMDVSFEVLDEHGETVCQTIMREIATEQERIAEDEKHIKLFAAAPDMLSALKDVPDPHDEGFCDSCSTRRQLPLKKEGERYFFQHDESCWYGKIQAAIAKAEKQP